MYTRRYDPNLEQWLRYSAQAAMRLDRMDGALRFYSWKGFCTESSLYAQAGMIGKLLGQERGGDWQSNQEEQHFQLKIGLKISECREAAAVGLLRL